MTTNEALIEIALILRGEHTGYGGDSLLAAERYLSKLVQAGVAGDIARDIDRKICAASQVSGLSVNRCQWIINRIQEKL